jgi:hypothetical protein
MTTSLPAWRAAPIASCVTAAALTASPRYGFLSLEVTCELEWFEWFEWVPPLRAFAQPSSVNEQTISGQPSTRLNKKGYKEARRTIVRSLVERIDVRALDDPGAALDDTRGIAEVASSVAVTLEVGTSTGTHLRVRGVVGLK